MKRNLRVAACLAFASGFAQHHYPETKTVAVSDTYFGTKVDDPYRWLENVKDPAVLDWFKAQDAYSESVLQTIPNQKKLLEEMIAYDKIGADKYQPIGKFGNFYFYKKRIQGEQVAKFYKRDSANGRETLLFDPTQYIAGKVMDFKAEVSSDGSRAILNISEAGSEIGDVRILDVHSGKLLADVIPHSEGYFVDGDNSRILYLELKNYDVHDPEVFLNSPAKLHRIGTNAASDVLVASAAHNPELGMKPAEWPMLFSFEDSPYLFLSLMTVDNYLQLYVAPVSDLGKNRIEWKPFSKKSDEIWKFFVSGEDVYVLTSKNNPNFRLIKTSAKRPDFANATEILSGNAEWKLSEVTQAKDFLIISKSKNEVVFEPFAFHMKSGTTEPLRTPLNGNAEASAVSRNCNEVKIINSEWNIPLDYYHYDLDAHAFSNGPFHSGVSVPGIENIVYEEIEIPSHDGALVPLSIVYDKTKMRNDGGNVALMYGYGAYGMPSYLPTFSSHMLPLLNCGAVLAFAHVRGGGEKGQQWYLGGKKQTKPNTWKDFNACAEYLIKNGYTAAQRLGITGSSAGGILVGRAITERPDLYRVAIPKVGCLNALRMEFSPNGPGNIPEFGTVEIESEFRALLEMDAYLHIAKGQKYPAQLITTGFNDPRVDSYIPAKFAARMQSLNGSSYPVLLDVDYKAGHYGGSTASERFTQYAREYAFLLSECGHPEFAVQK